ncbi:thioredoxin [Wenyingzhuangia sp. chi5]|uniref:Thioredoxin n=2 Tax=Wenyingzhuangia gilva TaxID=3057677 RepID=A0ABT8VPK7_9FLAO|nr:thioredoxin [Wenyingzhuangia sp. chi5]MDO3693913.1 thioredoxin [Wenyingzhuangia sp. chi5]
MLLIFDLVNNIFENKTQNNNRMVQTITKQDFLDKVFNFEKSQEWDFAGEVPAIIDFYADWCGPCKALAPLLEELQKEYNGKINIYKVDTEAEQELAGAFGIRSIPSLLFCPKGEKPQMAQGALPKQQFEELIKDILKVEK